MSEPTQAELKESIDELTLYRDRLKEEVSKASQKLKIPSQKINSTLLNHEELQKVEAILQGLKKQFEFTINN